jgi:hypothetical protein
VPVGIWALWRWYDGSSPLPLWLLPLVAANLVFFALSITMLYIRTWRRTALVLDSVWARIWYMLRVNPLFVMVWWLVWLIPLAIGFKMYLRDEGLVWERTEKSDANNELVRGGVAAAPEPAARSLREASRPSAVAGMAGPSPIPSPSRSSANV